MKTVLHIVLAVMVFFGVWHVSYAYIPEIASDGFIIPKTKLFLTYGTALALVGLVLAYKKIK
jgi:hypothetical protein